MLALWIIQKRKRPVQHLKYSKIINEKKTIQLHSLLAPHYFLYPTLQIIRIATFCVLSIVGRKESKQQSHERSQRYSSKGAKPAPGVTRTRDCRRSSGKVSGWMGEQTTRPYDQQALRVSRRRNKKRPVGVCLLNPCCLQQNQGVSPLTPVVESLPLSWSLMFTDRSWQLKPTYDKSFFLLKVVPIFCSPCCYSACNC